MAIFKCKICGGSLEIDVAQTVATCEYCGTKQTLPRLDDERRANLYDRANHFRRNNDFDKAMGIFEQILNEDLADAEAYWSIVLCRYGIEYVEDPATRRRLPTVNRAQFTSIFDDEDYKSAIANADVHQRDIYEAEATAINEIQKGILAISQKEEPFDIFICYKETDNNGRRTQDSVIATELYHELTREGFKVFFARITLEDRLGQEYEPYIFAALNSAKVMVVLGTKPEHFNAVWVKNEWSRYLSLTKNGARKVLIPAYRDMDPYDLPEEFSHLQAQDMSKLGFMQDLTRGIKKVIEVATPSAIKKEIAVTATAVNVEPLLKRVFLFLEDGEFDRADGFCEQILNQDPENAQAYLGKLMAELRVKRQMDLADCEETLDGNRNFQKAMRFADSEFSEVLRQLMDEQQRRREDVRRNRLYDEAVNYSRSDDIGQLEKALKIFESILGWKDVEKQIVLCQTKIKQKTLLAEQMRAKQERRDKIWGIIAGVLLVLIILAIVVTAIVVGVKNKKYHEGDGYLFGLQKENGGYVVTTYRGDDTVVVVPSEMDGIPVVRIADKAFSENKNIKKLIISEGVEKVENLAFMNCTALEYVQIPDSVREIGGGVFYGCKRISSVILPFVGMREDANPRLEWLFHMPNTSNGEIPKTLKTVRITGGTTIYASAFKDCCFIEEIVLPNTLQLIEYNAFVNCKALKEIIIPASVISIGSASFAECTSLQAIDFLGNSQLERIQTKAFHNCSALESILIPANVTFVGKGAFAGCDNLESITLPFVGATSDGSEDAYFGHIFGANSYEENDENIPKSLKNVTITQTTFIPNYAFYLCENLMNIEFPIGLKTIGTYAFAYCHSLIRISLMQNLKSIEEGAFLGCYKLIEVCNLSEISLSLGAVDNGCVTAYAKHIYTNYDIYTRSNLISTDDNGYIFYDDGNTCYLIGYVGKSSFLTLPSKNGKNYDIYQSAFRGREDIEGVTIPVNVTSIGQYAFFGCDNLITASFERKDGWYYYYNSGTGQKMAAIYSSALASLTNAANCLTTAYSANRWIYL